MIKYLWASSGRLSFLKTWCKPWQSYDNNLEPKKNISIKKLTETNNQGEFLRITTSLHRVERGAEFWSSRQNPQGPKGTREELRGWIFWWWFYGGWCWLMVSSVFHAALKRWRCFGMLSRDSMFEKPKAFLFQESGGWRHARMVQMMCTWYQSTQNCQNFQICLCVFSCISEATTQAQLTKHPPRASFGPRGIVDHQFLRLSMPARKIFRLVIRQEIHQKLATLNLNLPTTRCL